jgi:nucleoid DNA-binding protein
LRKHSAVEFALYIKNLLYNHDVVIIPNFGGLITKYKPAEIDTVDYSVTPPSKIVMFDSTRNVSDGLLLHYIAEQKKISFKEAEEYVNREVKTMVRKMDSGETIILEGIGYLSKEMGEVRFEREQGANFYTDSFGFSKVGFTTIEPKITPQNKPIVISESKPEKSFFSVYLFLLVFITIVSVVVVYLLYPIRIGQLLKIPPSAELTQIQDIDTFSKDSVRINDLENFFDNATDKKKALAIDPSINSVKSRIDGTYYLVVGSFVDFEHASKFAKQMDKQGLKCEVIQFSQETFRVTIGEYNDKNKAIEELLKVRAVRGEDAVWLFSK